MSQVKHLHATGEMVYDFPNNVGHGFAEQYSSSDPAQFTQHMKEIIKMLACTAGSMLQQTLHIQLQSNNDKCLKDNLRARFAADTDPAGPAPMTTALS